MRTAFQGMRRSPRLAAAGLALLAMAAQPAPAPAPTRAVGDLVLLTSETVIPGDLYAVGNQVRMEGEVRGDMVAAVTRDVLVTGTIDGDAVVVGGSLVIEGSVGGSVRVLSGSVEVRGTVGGDVLAGAGRVTVAETGSVGGDVITAAVSLDVAGEIGRGILGRVWRGLVSGGVGGNVELDARRLELAGDAQIEGDVRYRSPSDLVVGDDVEVVGTVGRMSNVPAVRARSVLVVTWVLGTLAFLVSGLLIHLAAPGWSGRAADSVRRRPFVSVLAGLIALLAVAALLAVVALVVLLSAPDLAVAIVAVSLPFTIGAVGLLGLGLVLGPVPVATAVGGMVARRASPFTHFLVAAPLVVAMPFVPVVGWPILAVVVITGLGAWVRGIRPRRRVPRPAPVPNQP
jgi:cytoskeletal protein CcmA (bactofilin family)